MSNSQIFYSNDYKVFPTEMVFMDGNQKLTILQDYDFSGTGDVSAFFHIDPYNTLPTYNALCMYKDNPSNKPFVSIDKLPNNNVFVSTGGEYVLTKNGTTYPTGICYSLPTVTMVKSNIIQTKWLEHSFVKCTVDFFGELISFPEDPITIMYRCIIN